LPAMQAGTKGVGVTGTGESSELGLMAGK
jgi:hypothetical protein